jgi:hydrogenase maturation protease
VTARVQVFVCGEPTRGDDAAGFAAVALLPVDVRARAEIREVGRLDVLFLLDLPADEACIVVDAVAGIPAGEVWVSPLPALVGRARALADAGRAPEPRSSHELPIEQVLALAATLRDAPPAGTFVGIGGSCWEVGTPLTEAVAAGLPAFAAAITEAIETAGTPGAGTPDGGGYSG